MSANSPGADGIERRLSLAKTYLDIDRLDSAKTELAQVLAADPDNSRARYYLSFVDLAEDRAASACERLRTLLAESPNLDHAWRLLAFSELKVGNETAATTAAQRAVALSPHNAENHRALAAALFPSHPKRALQSVNAALQLDPQSVPSMLLRGETLARLRRRRAARQAYSQARAADPTSWVTIHDSAVNDARGGRFRQAILGLFRAAEANPARSATVMQNLVFAVGRHLSRVRIALMLCVAVLLIGYVHSDYRNSEAVERAQTRPTTTSAPSTAPPIAPPPDGWQLEHEIDDAQDSSGPTMHTRVPGWARWTAAGLLVLIAMFSMSLIRVVPKGRRRIFLRILKQPRLVYNEVITVVMLLLVSYTIVTARPFAAAIVLLLALGRLLAMPFARRRRAR